MAECLSRLLNPGPDHNKVTRTILTDFTKALSTGFWFKGFARSNERKLTGTFGKSVPSDVQVSLTSTSSWHFFLNLVMCLWLRKLCEYQRIKVYKYYLLQSCVVGGNTLKAAVWVNIFAYAWKQTTEVPCRLATSHFHSCIFLLVYFTAKTQLKQCCRHVDLVRLSLKCTQTHLKASQLRNNELCPEFLFC